MLVRLHYISSPSLKWLLQRRKIDAECRAFQEKWTNDYFFVEVEGKPVCLVCGDAIAVMKKANLERHYSTNMQNSRSCEDKCDWIKSKLSGGVWMHNNPLSRDLVVRNTMQLGQVMW